MANNAGRRPRRQIIYDDPIPLPWQTNNEFGIRFHEENALNRENQAEPEWRVDNTEPFSRTGIGYRNRPKDNLPEADKVIIKVLSREGQLRNAPKNKTVWRMKMYKRVQLARARKRKAVARRRVIGDENWGEMAVRPRRQRRRTGTRRRRRKN